MHFFGNTKLFCHFLLVDIEKVLYIYMPFYDGMATFKGGNCSTKEDVPCADYVFMADMWNPKHLSDSRHLWVPISWENGAPVLKKQ